jgi:hypothetical protein
MSPPADLNTQDDASSKINTSARFDGGAGVQGGVGVVGENFGTINIYDNTSSRSEAPAQQPRAHNLSLKFLADRDEQERRIRDHLVNLRMSRRPILFFVHGEASQSLDGFVDRLGKETMRRLLRAINNTDQIECKWVAWPDCGGEADRAAAYKNSLIDALEGTQRTPDEIVERVASRRRPVLLTSVHREEADRDEEPGIRAILDYWGSLPNLRTELSLIIVVGMIYAEPKRSFLARFRAQPKASALGQTLARFNGYRRKKLNVVVLPQLGDISLGEAEHWVRTWLRPRDIEESLKRVRKAFGTTGAAIPMDRLAPYLEALAPEDRERLRLQ